MNADNALALLAWAVTTFGPQLVMAVFGIRSGSTSGAIIEDVSIFVSDVLDVVRRYVDDDKIRSILDAQYAAADKAVDAVETARFGKRTP